jgi:hypothetical protein
MGLSVYFFKLASILRLNWFLLIDPLENKSTFGCICSGDLNALYIPSFLRISSFVILKSDFKKDGILPLYFLVSATDPLG